MKLQGALGKRFASPRSWALGGRKVDSKDVEHESPTSLPELEILKGKESPEEVEGTEGKELPTEKGSPPEPAEGALPQEELKEEPNEERKEESQEELKEEPNEERKEELEEERKEELEEERKEELKEELSQESKKEAEDAKVASEAPEAGRLTAEIRIEAEAPKEEGTLEVKEADDAIVALESQALTASPSPQARRQQVLEPTVVEVQEVAPPLKVRDQLLPQRVHVVLLGDSTLDNERYLDLNEGGEPVGMQLSRRCEEMDWELTMLATDGSTLDDVAIRQVPIIPDDATHIVLSASGNDLLRLLNEVASEEFSLSSLYSALTAGLQEVARKHRRMMESIKSIGCNVACCTVYSPNFKNAFLTGLSLCSLGLHNSRIRRIAEDLDMPVLDLASLCQSSDDFANPLELSTIGGRKVVSKVVQFVKEYPLGVFPRPSCRDGKAPWLLDVLGINTECCNSCGPRRTTHTTLTVGEEFAQETPVTAHPSDFAQAQEPWRRS